MAQTCDEIVKGTIMYMYRIKSLMAAVVICGVLLVSSTGCTGSLASLLGSGLGLVSPGTLLNLSSLGVIDAAGPRNLLLGEPDFSKDPTCMIPGMCGPSMYYPFSTAPDMGTGVTPGGGV